jgi:CHAT domain-containing protein
VFGRWQRKLGLRPKQQRLYVSGFVIMRPRYSANDLDWADDEVNALKGMVANAEEMRPVNNAAMLQLLDRNNVQMIHYTGHGDYQANADLNSLRLEDGPFPALSFLGTRLGQEAQPILYLNACSVGKAAPVAGQMGGFAANCLSGGWSGLIAPCWLINDERAAEFSRSLYAKLKLNRSIGEGLQELRIEHPDDPTYIAYSYIGDPWARPTFA